MAGVMVKGFGLIQTADNMLERGSMVEELIWNNTKKVSRAKTWKLNQPKTKRTKQALQKLKNVDFLEIFSDRQVSDFKADPSVLI